jgi:hypothetical protein
MLANVLITLTWFCWSITSLHSCHHGFAWGFDFFCPTGFSFWFQQLVHHVLWDGLCLNSGRYGW